MTENPLNISILTVVYDRDTGQVEVNWDGMNYLEAIGALTVAMNEVQESPFFDAFESEDDEDGPFGE